MDNQRSNSASNRGYIFSISLKNSISYLSSSALLLLLSFKLGEVYISNMDLPNIILSDLSVYNPSNIWGFYRVSPKLILCDLRFPCVSFGPLGRTNRTTPMVPNLFWHLLVISPFISFKEGSKRTEPDYILAPPFCAFGVFPTEYWLGDTLF